MRSKAAPAPSSVARTVAAKVWPDVQAQTKLARGVYQFSCAGHGGIVAVVGEAELPDENVAAMRELGRTEIVVIHPSGRRFTSVTHKRDSLTEYAERHGLPLIEVCAGEEDCDWAMLAYCSPAIRAGMERAGCSRVTEADAFDCLRRWNEEYLAALNPAYQFDPNGQVEAARIERELQRSGQPIRCSALGIADDCVHVLFRHADGRTEGRFMSADTYHAIPLSTVATPADFATFGETLGAPADFHDAEGGDA